MSKDSLKKQETFYSQKDREETWTKSGIQE